MPLFRPFVRPFSAFANHRNTEENQEETPFEFTPENHERVCELLTRYPDNYKSSAVIPALFIAQKQNDNFLTLAAMNKVAKILEMTPMQVYEVASFFTMFNRTKLQKKEGVKPTELEEDTAKSLTALETSNKDIARELRSTYINSVTEETFEADDGSAAKYILVKIPFRSLKFYKKVSSQVIDHLEKKFSCSVIVVVNRTIDSLRKVTHTSQKRPRSRTLKAVQCATLHDVVVPSSIVGRRSRYSPVTGVTEQVFLDPLDKMLVEEKVEAMADAYRKLTTHKVSIEFAKPTSFQKKKLEKLNAKRE